MREPLLSSYWTFRSCHARWQGTRRGALFFLAVDLTFLPRKVAGDEEGASFFLAVDLTFLPREVAGDEEGAPFFLAVDLSFLPREVAGARSFHSLRMAAMLYSPKVPT